jgi:lysyl-tRNA synthetase class 2
MRPEAPVGSLTPELKLDGVPSPWDDVLIKMGITTQDQLKAVNPNKLFNDLGGMRKKMKIEESLPSLDAVKSWIN